MRYGKDRRGRVWQSRMGKVGSGTVRSGPVWLGSRGTDVMGRVGYSAAAQVRTGKMCRGRVRSGWAGILQRSVKARSVQEGTREIRRSAVRKGSHGWVVCGRFGSGEV